MGIGLILLAGALMLTVYNIWDEHRADRVTQTVLASLEHQMISSEAKENTPTQSLAPSEVVPSDSQVDAETSDHLPAVVTALPSPALEQTSYPETMPTIEIDGNLYIGILEIPPLDLKLPVINSWSYEALRTAPCRYAGSVYQNNLVIAAHNYNAHFGSLSYLVPGDSVIVTDVNGNTFFFEVAEIQKLTPTALENALTDGWDLTLFTCTIGGQARLTVRCKSVDAA